VIGRFLRYLEGYKAEHPETAQNVDTAIQKGLRLLLDQSTDANN
jgi:hypothetical protein